MTEPDEVEIPEWVTKWDRQLRRQRHQDRAILLSWGMAVLILAGMFAFWVWSVQREKDRGMCSIIALSISGADAQIPPGPEGDHSRQVLAAMRAYERTLNC